MRVAMTDHERRLWLALKQRLPMAGTHFRRQFAIGPYIVDFCCLAHRLIVEVDGEQHGTDDARRYDERRTSYLTSQGFRVLRFWNHEVTREMESVLDTILASIHGGHPHP